MVRRPAFAALGLAFALVALGVTTQGCSNSSGRQLGATSTTSADLVVKNRSMNTLHVYVDGGEIGAAPPNGDARFQVLSGERTVEVRESGHSTRSSFGKLLFGFVEVEVTYRP